MSFDKRAGAVHVARTLAIIALFCSSHAGCKREPIVPSGTAARPAADRAGPSTPAPPARPVGAASSQPASQQASQPTSSPAASAPSSTPSRSGPSLTSPSPLTPKLQALVQGLQARRGSLKIKDELDRQIPGFATGDGKDLLEEARVEILEVRKGFLVMAFLRLTPRAHKPCDDKGPQQETHALYVGEGDDHKERIRLTDEYSASETLFFDGKRVKVVFPPIAATVPVFEVHYEYEPPCSSLEAGRGKMVELFHLASGERIADPVSLDTTFDVPGNDKTTRSRIEWLKGKAPGTALLAITEVKTDIIIPCTGEPDDRSAACRNQYECERTTRVFAVTAEGATEAEKLRELRRSEPALAKLPPDRTGKSEATCRRLEPK